MNIDPRRLVVLSAVDRYGGVVGAASALHVSPSAVSQQLAMLESETGFALVDRSRRGGQRSIELTTAGRRLVAHAYELVKVLEDAEGELTALAETVSGPVTISAFFTVLRGFAGAALVELGQRYPALTPHVVNLDDAEAVDDVLAGRIDLALVEDDAQRRRTVPRGLYYEALFDDPFRVAVPIDWPEFDDLAKVADRDWIDGPPDSATGQAMARVRRTTGLRLPAPHLCREFTAALAMVAVGLAGAILPELAFAASAPADIRVVSLPGLGARRIGVVYRSSRNEPTPAVRVVLDALRSAAAG
ncbi:LysR family transcriptional regulator [Jatrophihabitans endophyticus]|uniref:LysR family transcriptional regulator n=1 Tax=Jatrophihabitans endophyticus TaxID=1206085 RepID=UPI001A0114CB|nr:LysR family transcriptional regulator [Jatrophihabitans endophyticus]MBE7189538.1 LysR family transcriptional regulator [Jatrophihabitans endophyticus]